MGGKKRKEKHTVLKYTKIMFSAFKAMSSNRGSDCPSSICKAAKLVGFIGPNKDLKGIHS